jgi:putative MATE family efflux protein
MTAGSVRKFTLWALAWPIFIELFLQFLLGAADTLMVSKISDDAVAVVGFSNQLFFALTTLFVSISSGAGILIAQRLGSKKEEDARNISTMSLAVTSGIGLLLSIVLFYFPLTFARWLQFPEQLFPLAETYISIVGGGMLLMTMMITLSTVIRSTGNTRGPMYVAVGMNVIHVVLNYAFIFGAFGFPQLGLLGVAYSTTLSRLLAMLVLLWMYVNAFERRIAWSDFRVFHRGLFAEVLRIGWPIGVNAASWTLSQLAIYSFIAVLGAKELAARTYMNTMESFCFMLGWSIALALQIQIAHLYGAGRTQEAYRNAYRALRIGLVVVTVNVLLLYLLGPTLLGLFTADEEIIAMGVTLLGLNLLLQPGKMVNMALGNSLGAVGDTRYVMYTGLVSLSLIATLASYWFGIRLGWGLVAIYLCMICDEYLRGALSFIRWRGQLYLRRGERQPAEVMVPRTADQSV